MIKRLFPYGTALLSLGALFFVLAKLAPEVGQGYVQKIFFFHVPSAFAMYGCLSLGAIFSGLYLFQRRPNFDRWAQASMQGAILFGLIVMVSGPIWAKPIWGVYWTWDPRLTTTFIVFILMLAYFFVRGLFKDRQQNDRAALVGAILALFAICDVPIIHLSVKLWRGIHPSVIRNPNGLPPDYQLGLELMTLAFLLVAGLYVWLFYRILELEESSNA